MLENCHHMNTALPPAEVNNLCALAADLDGHVLVLLQDTHEAGCGNNLVFLQQIRSAWVHISRGKKALLSIFCR